MSGPAPKVSANHRLFWLQRTCSFTGQRVRWGFRNLLVVNDKKNDFVLDVLHTNQLLCSQDRNTLKDICVILCFINISMLENGC